MSNSIAIFVELFVRPSLLLQGIRIRPECEFKGKLIWNPSGTVFDELVKQGDGSRNSFLLGGRHGQELVSKREVVVCTGIWRKDCVLQQLAVLIQENHGLLFRDKIIPATDPNFKVCSMRKQLNRNGVLETS
jgi:hypothetical protein